MYNLRQLVGQNIGFFMRKFGQLSQELTNEHGEALLVNEIKIIRVPKNTPQFETQCLVRLEEHNISSSVVLGAIKTDIQKGEPQQGAAAEEQAPATLVKKEITISFDDLLESVQELSQSHERKAQDLEEKNKSLTEQVEQLKIKVKQGTGAQLNFAEELAALGEEVATTSPAPTMDLFDASDIEELKDLLQAKHSQLTEISNELDAVRAQKVELEAQVAALKADLLVPTEASEASKKTTATIIFPAPAQEATSQESIPPAPPEEASTPKIVLAKPPHLPSAAVTRAPQQVIIYQEAPAPSEEFAQQLAKKDEKINAQAAYIARLEAMLAAANVTIAEDAEALDEANQQSQKTISKLTQACNEKDQQIADLQQVNQVQAAVINTLEQEIQAATEED